MIDIYFKTLKDRKFKKIDTYRAGCWINVERANPEDLDEIARITELERADLEDALDLYEVPRIERQEGKNIIVFVRNPGESEPSRLHTELLTLIITPKYFITISPQTNKNVQNILSMTTSIATTQKSKLFFRILLRIAQSFTSRTKAERNKVHARHTAMKRVRTRDIMSLSESEDVLNQYISALVPMNHVFDAIKSGKYISLYHEDEDLLDDLSIAIRQSASICDVNLKNITSARESYQVLFTNNLNKTIKLLTSLTIILTIPTIIASLFGMNVPLPFANNHYAFLIVLGISFLFSFVVLLLFYFEEWL